MVLQMLLSFIRHGKSSLEALTSAGTWLQKGAEKQCFSALLFFIPCVISYGRVW